MKKTLINRIVVLVLLFVMLSLIAVMSLTSLVDSTAYASDTTTISRSLTSVSPQEKKASEAVDFILKEKQKKEEEKNKLKKDQAKTISEIMTSSLKTMTSIKDAIDGSEVETMEIVDSIFTMVSSITATCGPWGLVASGVIDVVKGLIDLELNSGGDTPKSELVLLEDRLNMQFDEIKDSLSDIQDQIAKLSNQINDQTNQIISAMVSALDNSEAKQNVSRFMSSSDGNFSYSRFSNYIHGGYDTKTNIYASEAYNAKLKKSVRNGDPDSVVRKNYDTLYKALAANSLMLYGDYLLVDTTSYSKSIIKYYYDCVSARPEFLGEDETPETMAVEFAENLFSTAIEADLAILQCNYYQYLEAWRECAKNGSEFNDYTKYYFDEENDDGITIREIHEMQESIEARWDLLEIQLADDLAYILNSGKSYVISTADGEFHDINQGDISTFGELVVGETVYLNTLSDVQCEYFGFDKSAFVFTVDGQVSTGKFVVGKNVSSINAKLEYQGKEIYSINFSVGSSDVFSGGSGEQNNPYLISNAKQLVLINNGLDKHYLLLNNIEFNESYRPIGYFKNNNNTHCFNEFTGTFDGNGYSISNINISEDINSGSSICLGLFGSIGVSGHVKNLTLYGGELKATCNGANKTNSAFYGGAISGINYGSIKNCVINNISVEYTLANSETDRHTDLRVGGVTGENQGRLESVVVRGGSFKGNATRNISAQDCSNNHNTVLVGGICGYNGAFIKNALVENNPTVEATAKTEANVSGKNIKPFVTTAAGGIAGKTGDLTYINNVYVSSVNTSVPERRALAENTNKTWGSHMTNLKSVSDTYFALFDKDEYNNAEKINSTKANSASDVQNTIIKKSSSTTTFKYVDKNGKDITTESCTYEAGSTDFKKDGLKFYVNNVEVNEYSILGVYGFNAQNKDFNVVAEHTVTVLFDAKINSEWQTFAQDIKIKVGKNYIKQIDVIGLQPNYKTGKFDLGSVNIKFIYAVGTDLFSYSQVGSSNVTIGGITDKVIFEGDTITLGSNEWIFKFGSIQAMYTVNIKCNHNSNFIKPSSGYVQAIDGNEMYNWLVEFDNENGHGSEGHQCVLPKDASCTEIGWDTYVCTTCYDIQKFYHSKVAHNIDLAADNKESTCYSTGWAGKLVCVNDGCNFVYDEGYELPMKNHDYHQLQNDGGSYARSEYHVCDNGDNSHYERHQFSITRSVEIRLDDNSAQYNVLVYNYTCISCGYFTSEEDDNIVVDDNLPTVKVSSGYAVHGGDKVIVYVQLLNNTNGIAGGNFGIRYSEKLTLVEAPIPGDIISGSWLNGMTPVNCGYNLYWGNAVTFVGDGNLVKLVFKVPHDAIKGDEYDINIVYDFSFNKDGAKIDGGFVNKAGVLIRFKSVNGSIKMVDHLPGDVNDDGVVDVLDAMEIGMHLISGTGIQMEYADVNLDGITTIADVVLILRSITGGYGVNLLDREFKVLLNTNGFNWDGGYEYLDVELGGQYCHENIELEREGYKFLGWFYQPVATGDKDDTRLDLTNPVIYKPTQKQQTLYARWEMNQIELIINGQSEPIISYSSALNANNKITLANKGDIVTPMPLIIGIADWNGPQECEAVKEFIGWLIVGVSKDNIIAGGEILDLSKPDFGGKIKIEAIWGEPNIMIEKDEFKKMGYSGFSIYNGPAVSQSQLVYSADFSTSTSDYNVTAINIDRVFKDLEGEKPKNFYTKFKVIEYIVFFDYNENDGNEVNDYDSLPNGTFSIEKPFMFPEYRDTGNVGAGQYKLLKYGNNLLGWVDDADYAYSVDGDVIPAERIFEEGFLKKQQDGKLALILTAVWQSKLNIVQIEGTDTCVVAGIPDTYGVMDESAALESLGNDKVNIPSEYRKVLKDANGKLSKPLSVVAIGESAFKNKNLCSVDIPESVTKIDAEAFAGCTRIADITILDSVTSIGFGAFSGCSGLTNITIPFVGNELNGTDNAHFGYIFGANSSSQHSSYVPNSIKTVAITGGESICNSAFYNCSMITSITMPESIARIGAQAFYGCSSLTSITIPENVTSIGDLAFSSCNGLTTINWNAIDCIRAGSAPVLANNDRFEEYYYHIFNYCTKITIINIGDNVKNIPDFAFYGCSRLTSITIPDSVISIGTDAFYGCSGLKSVYIITDIANWCGITFGSAYSNPLYYVHNLHFNGELISDLIIPESVNSIGSYAFSGCSGLTSITIPENVTKIGNGAFSNCSGLLTVNWNAIDCEEAGSGPVKYPGGFGNYSYGAPIFNGCTKLSSVIIGERVTCIPAYAFYNCGALTNIIIPNSVTRIGKGAFACSGLTSITIPDSVTNIISDPVYSGGPSTQGTTTYPYSGAFSNCSSLTTVNWNAVACSEAGNSSYPIFAKCSKLSTISIGNNVKSIPSYAFYDCSSLTSIMIPDSVTSIGSYAFSGSGLTSITISASMTSIANSTFYNCSGLTNIMMPNSVTSIGDYAFAHCSSLTNITIPKNVTSIGNSAFYDTALITVNWNATACLSAGKDYEPIFRDCTNLLTVNIGNNVTTIPSYAFYDCSSLTSLMISDSVTSIGAYAFDETAWYNNQPDGVVYAGKVLYKYKGTMPANTEVKIKNGTKSIVDYAFYNCSGLTSITISDNVTSIGYRAFYNCNELTSITIPASMASIGKEAFYGCNELTSVSFGNTENWEVSTFSNFSSVTRLDSTKLAGPATAAQYLKSTYYNYYWRRVA